MSEIRIGAEVTFTGKVEDIATFDYQTPQYRVMFDGERTLWFKPEAFISVKNPPINQPDSEYILIDGVLAWRNPDDSWETRTYYFYTWSELMEELQPAQVVELVAGKVIGS